RCSAKTAQNRRCSQAVDTHNALSYPTRSRLPHFCGRHLDELVRPTHFLSPKTGWRVAFSGTASDYIPTYLDQRTQLLLRMEMMRDLSPTEEAGFIYCLKLSLPRSESDHVGRTNDVYRRLREWRTRCRSSRPALLGYIQTSKAHLLERLVQLELYDMTANVPYIHVRFPDVSGGLRMGAQFERSPCKDCHARHQEIFHLPRRRGSIGTEWALIVWPMVERYKDYIENHR
ncbi:hypothetical protein C8Q80DRAFT_1094948, partial [Daedaleopsis nitida]